MSNLPLILNPDFIGLMIPVDTSVNLGNFWSGLIYTVAVLFSTRYIQCTQLLSIKNLLESTIFDDEVKKKDVGLDKE
jgi:hypothetical protein